MGMFLLIVSGALVCFGLGYYVSGHPTDTRNFLARVRDSLGRLIHRDPAPPK